MTTLIAFSGSLRKDSFNTRVLRALPALAPDDVHIAFFDTTELPMYNGDLDGETVPPIVAALRAAVAEADGVIFATPEYNHSYSAATKNIVDWASRPMMAGAILGKKSMVISTTPGPGGGVHAISATSELLTLLGGTVVGTASAAKIHEKFSPNSDVIVDDEFARQLMMCMSSF